MADAMPLSRRQSAALAGAVVRELGGGLQSVALELRRWRVRALTIPDLSLRSDALNAFDCKRGHIVGAAVFWTLPSRRHRQLLRLLVAYELIYDYLDNVSERGAAAGLVDGLQLTRALVDSLDPDCSSTDYYRGLPWHDDGGFLLALVDACRAACVLLPSFALVRPHIAIEVARTPVLGMNHELDAQARDVALRRWAEAEFPDERDLRWYELTAASSQSLVCFALLALAADPDATAADAEAVYRAYFPWFAYAVTMLDAYVDQAEDERAGAHSYVAHYPEPELAVARLCESVERAAEGLLGLPNGERHAVLLGCMVALYLSKDSASAPELREATARIRRAGGSLTRLLVPVLRLWRILNAQTDKT